LAEAQDLDTIAADPVSVVLPLATAMRDLERLDVDAEQAKAASHGIAFPAGALGDRGNGPYALVGPGGDLVAVYQRSAAACKPAVVLVGNN
jgi:tRNA pseudouridine55 synthase